MKKIDRRDFISQSLKISAGLTFWPYLYSCENQNSSNNFHKKIVILGIDGMDPFLLKKFVYEGNMPNFLKLIHKGSFKKMRSSIPPQSPVAWSDFSVGASAQVHGIFDFIHRDPKTMTPYLSTASVSISKNTFEIGEWEIPLGGGTANNLREGKPFWEYLGESGIPVTIFKMPGEFPVNSKTAKCVSGMGTPDILGSYGTFSFFTTNPLNNKDDITGGVVYPVKAINNEISAELLGPINTLKKGKPSTKIPFQAWRDAQNMVAKVKIQDNELLLTQGEWSDWIQLSFELVPHIKSIKGICKILLKQIHPHFEMYVSPINIDPVDQSLPIITPENFAVDLVEKIGLFNTKGLPADTKALSYGILSEEEYLQSSDQIFNESRRALQYELNKLQSQNSGVLFHYLSNLDQDSHMYWRAIDKNHPMYTEKFSKNFNNTIRNLYIKMDQLLGDVLSQFDLDDQNFRLIVMSDHGFAPFYRSVNLNTWLLRNGYISLINSENQEDFSFFENVNWAKTRAYGLGINALYLNRSGREKYGIVSGLEVEKLKAELKTKLLSLKDPVTHENAVSAVWIGKEIYNREDDKTPDLIIGWNRGYRASWETVLGSFPKEVFVDNNDKWSGDHCIDPFWVPAVLMANKKISIQHPILPDVTATILAECNISIPTTMTGKPLYEI